MAVAGEIQRRLDDVPSRVAFALVRVRRRCRRLDRPADLIPDRPQAVTEERGDPVEERGVARCLSEQRQRGEGRGRRVGVVAQDLGPISAVRRKCSSGPSIRARFNGRGTSPE